MMVRLDNKERHHALGQLLADVVYVICHDGLRQMRTEGRTELSPVELFLSAREFTQTLLALPDMEEGLEDEMDFLEDECEGDEAVIVLMVSTAQMQAVSRKRQDLNLAGVIKRIFLRVGDHELFFPLLEAFADKEQERWLQNKRNNLLSYELRETELHGDEEEARDIYRFALDMDTTSISNSMNLLNAYNNEHCHAFDKEIANLCKKLKEPKVINTEKYIEAHDNKNVTIQK